MPRIEFRALHESGQTLLASVEAPSSVHILADCGERTKIQVPPEEASLLQKKVGEMIDGHPGASIHIFDGEEGSGGNLFYQHETFFPIKKRIKRFTSSVVTPKDIEPYTDGKIGEKYDENEAVFPLV